MYVKITRDDNLDRYHCRIGLNTCESGLYFVAPRHTFDRMYGDKVCIITIPKDTQVVKWSGNYIKSDAIIIEKIMYLWDIKTIQYLISIGADIHYNGGIVVQYASRYGCLDIVQYLVLLGVNITSWALCHASERGHLDVVKYLVSLGTNIHAINNLALHYASIHGHVDVVQYLISMGAKYPISVGVNIVRDT